MVGIEEQRNAGRRGVAEQQDRGGTQAIRYRRHDVVWIENGRSEPVDNRHGRRHQVCAAAAFARDAVRLR